MAALEKSSGVDRRFSVANSPWSTIETCERMMREVVRTRKAMIRSERRAKGWIELVPAIQWALHTAFRERYGSTPYPVMFGGAPRVELSALASSIGQDWQVDVLDEKAVRAKVQSVVAAQSQLYKEALDKVQVESW